MSVNKIKYFLFKLQFWFICSLDLKSQEGCPFDTHATLHSKPGIAGHKANKIIAPNIITFPANTRCPKGLL